MGKTVCLVYIAEDAESCGWISISSSAIPRLLEDLYEQALLKSSHLIEDRGARPTSVSIGPISAGWEYGSDLQGNWRTRMGAIMRTVVIGVVGTKLAHAHGRHPQSIGRP